MTSRIVQRYDVWYSLVNGGDGSAMAVFFDTPEEAEAHQELEGVSSDEYDCGWAEPCWGQVEVWNDF